jgi:hypothetical protein
MVQLKQAVEKRMQQEMKDSMNKTCAESFVEPVETSQVTIEEKSQG